MSKKTTSEKTTGGLVQRLVNRFPDYAPTPGYYDLRCFDFTDEDFKTWWEIQSLLITVGRDPEYYRKCRPGLWDAARDLSHAYRKMLYTRPASSR